MCPQFVCLSKKSGLQIVLDLWAISHLSPVLQKGQFPNGYLPPCKNTSIPKHLTCLTAQIPSHFIQIYIGLCQERCG